MSDHPANPSPRSEAHSAIPSEILLGNQNSRICRAGVALLAAEAFAEALHTTLRALPPRQPPCRGPSRPCSPVGAADAARASCGVAPACDLPAISILPAIVPACPEETAVTHFDPLASRPDARRMTRRRSPRRGSGREGRHHLHPPTLSMLSQLVSMTAMSSPRVLHLLRRVVRRLAPHGASKSQKQACACHRPGDAAAVASGISLPAAARLEGARGPQSCRSDHLLPDW